MKSIDTMSLPELKELSAKVESAIATAKARERDELRKTLTAMAAKSGFKVSDLFGAKQTIAPKYRDKKTGVLWTGRGRPPLNFDKSRAETLSY